MKLLRLSLKNLNSIREQVSIDLEKSPLSETSLFAITGPTGSGKTTLLDALSVALYHKTPRLDSKDAKNPDNLLSQGSSEGYSEVLFEANGKRYLSEWRVKRSKSNCLSSSVKLIDAETGHLLNDKKQNNPIVSILGLDFDSFRRSVLLAQGEFAAFLKAKLDDKRQLLESTTGMGIYDELREVLNQKLAEVRSAYERLKASLETIDKSDKKEIEATEQKLSKLKKELAALQAQRTEVSRKREAESKRTNAWNQLKAAEERHSKLLDRQAEMQSLETELKQARSAADLLTPKKSFDIEQANLDDIQAARKTTSEQLAKTEETLTQHRAEAEKYETAYLQLKESAAKQSELISVAFREETQAAGLEDEAQKRSIELARLQKEIGLAEQNLKEWREQQTQLQSRITQAEETLLKTPLPPEPTKLIAQVSQNMAILRETKNTLDETVKEGKAKRVQLDDAKAKQAQFKAEYEQLLKKRARLLHCNELISKDMQPILAQGDEGAWELRRNRLQPLQEVALDYERNRNQAISLSQQIEADNQKLQQINQKLASAETERSGVEQELSRIASLQLQLKQEEKSIALSAHAADLRKEHLESGKPCPVCGSKDHPWADKAEPETEARINEIREKLLAAEKEYQQRQDEFQRLENAKAALLAVQEQHETHAKSLHQQLDDLQNEMDQCTRQWMTHFHDKPVSSQFIKDEIQQCEQAAKRFREALERGRTVENELLDLKAALSGKEIEQSHCQTDIEKLTQERTDLLMQHKKSSQRIEQLSQDIQTQLPAEFRGRDPEASLKKLQSLLETHEQFSKKLAQLKQDLAKVQTQITENEKTAGEMKQRFEQLKSEIDQYRHQAGNLRAQVAEKTGGLSPQDARKKLDAHLQTAEDQRTRAQKQFQATQQQKAEFESLQREQRQQHEKSQKRFEEARDAYLEQVKAAGFDSIEAHQNAIRTAQWLHQSENALQDYRQQRYSVEQTMHQLQKEFEEKAFDPEHLKSLQEQEQKFELSIQDTNSEIGKANEKLANQKQNFDRYKNLEKALTTATAEYERWNKLNDVIGANKLRDYALKSMFDLLIRFANQQMKKLTSRYVLRVKDMKEMVVVDTWNAGEERPVETLSGGESFLTSLSLALALSELSKGGAKLGALFLDEGFGSLDSETLEIALDALESLRLTGRRVGIISHVQELTRRIPVRIAVNKKGDGSSTVAIEGTI
ncbi:AAA family ATPase [candidate division KSB1 bacterium]|nr:AAA family ATPase [candidate division KSB1 bacterium]